ncbi:MAG: FAD-binding oxidoreductase [Phycisphaerae bacterium]
MTAVQPDAAEYARIADVVRRCESRGDAAQICGGATLVRGERAGVMRIDTRSLDRLIEHAVADMTVTVQAGMTVAALQARLAEHGQELALDVPRPDRSTVGGAVAMNLSGSRRLACGAVRDQLIGLRVVGAGGELIRGGGRVVKNVAGYDLCKLYTGSRGWLGVIVEATFRVAAKPEAAGALLVACDDADAAERALAALRGAPLAPNSIDLLNARATAVALPGAPGAAPLRVLVGFDGARDAVEWQIAEARRWFATDAIKLRGDELATARQELVNRLVAPDEVGDSSDAGAARGDAPRSLPPTLSIRFSLPGARLAAFIVEQSRRAPDAPLWSQFASGVAYVAYPQANPEHAGAAVASAAALGGAWQVVAGGDVDELPFAPLGPRRDEWELMRRVKRALDPHDVFERGGAFDRAFCAT